MSFRVGLGIDFHRYRQGRKLILGGVLFDYPMGLFGHSDADVVAHAAADAVLGAQVGRYRQALPGHGPGL
jgi:2-C-methyl-D-erythritol 2,4-cyclodiphosphate synthase